MRLNRLKLDFFRGLSSWTQDFSSAQTLILGMNGSGKTSILEAISLLALGKSFRAETSKEMIQLGQELARITAELNDGTEEMQLEMILTNGQVQGRRTVGQLYSVNGVRRRRAELVGKLAVVSFRPEDMRLVEGSPSRRRAFLDQLLCQVSQEYAQSLRVYEAALIRRNRLLDQVQQRQMPVSVLHYWTQQLLVHGQIIQAERRKFVEYCPEVTSIGELKLVYLASIVSDERQQLYAEREVAAGHTLIGPHKDDLQLFARVSDRLVELQDLAKYGSRGQQRLGVLWLKLAELSYLTKMRKQRPLLLLDDIFSELDLNHRQLVVSQLIQGQAIITTAEVETADWLSQQPTLSKMMRIKL